MRESEIETHLNWQVAKMGGLSFKFKSPNNRGVSDRVVCLPDGRVWFIELKAPKGKRSPLQIMFADSMQAMGQKYALLSSVEHVQEWARING
jgi:hypothetical protein